MPDKIKMKILTLDEKLTILSFRGIIFLVLGFFLLYSPAMETKFSFAIFGVLGIYLLSDMALLWIPAPEFMNFRLLTVLFLFDTLFISWFIYVSQGWNTDLYLVYFLVIFMSGMQMNIWQSFLIGTVASLLYLVLWTTTHPRGDFLNTALLIRLPFFYIVSSLTAFFAEQVKEQERLLKQLTIDAEEERNQAKEAQQQHQQKLEIIINQSDALVLVWRIESDRWPVEFVSGNVADILGYTPDDFLSGRVSWPGITHQDDNPRLEKEVARYLEKGDRKWLQEYRLIIKSGEIRWFRGNSLALADSAGRITKIQAVIYDITERKQAEEALREGEKRLKTILDSILTGIIIVDEKTREIVDLNPAAAGIFGAPKDQIIGKVCHKFVCPAEMGKCPIGDLGQAVDKTERIMIRAADNEDIPVIKSVASVRLGGRLCFVESFIDITKLKKKEESRKLVSTEIIRVREEEKKRFAAAIHDIAGSMLVGLSSALLLVEEEFKQGDANRALVRVYQTRNLVKELVEMMKNVCVDIWPPNMEIAGLPGALSELLSRFNSYAKIKACHRIDLPVDWEKTNNRSEIVIYRLVQEALSNAVKYSKAKNLELIINYDDKKVMLSISDDGCGFETDKVESGKSSLGLKIMREQVESVGGNILLDSKPGRGTVIKAEFPVNAQP